MGQSSAEVEDVFVILFRYVDNGDNDNVGDSTPTTSTMGTLWDNSGISFKVSGSQDNTKVDGYLCL